MRKRSLGIAIAGAVLLGGAAGASPGSAAPSHRSKIVRLSNETTRTYSAYPLRRAAVYAGPSARSRRVSTLHLETEDGLPELYLVLARKADPAGDWIKLRLPQRPNGLTGWVRGRNLGPLRLVRTRLVVERSRLRITLYRNGRRVFRAPLGIGKPSTPTPGGHFWIREHFRVRGNPLYGPYAIGTSAHAPTLTEWPNGGVVGIHGTDQPGLVPGRPSHGCMRMHNSDIRRLYRMLPLGTPLRIV